MSDEIFFELVRDKAHYFLDATASTTVDDVKKTLATISTYAPQDVSLLWRADDTRWVRFEDGGKTLGESGLTKENAAAQKPAYLAILLGEEKMPVVSPLSTPPDLPDSMRADSGSN